MPMQPLKVTKTSDSDDEVVPIGEPPKRPFSRISKQRTTQPTPSMASELSLEKNGVKQVPSSHPAGAASIDSDDSVHIPGSSKPRLKRGRKSPRDRVRATDNRRKQQQRIELMDRIHTVDSASDSDHLPPTHIANVKSSSQRRALQVIDELSPERSPSTSRVRSSDHKPLIQKERFTNDRDDKLRLGTRNRVQKPIPVPRRKNTRQASHSIEIKNIGLKKLREDRRKRERKDPKNGAPMVTRSAKQRLKEEVEAEPINVDDYAYDSEYENEPHRQDQSNEGNGYDLGGNSDLNDSSGKSKLPARIKKQDTPQPEKESNKSEVVSLDQKEAAEELTELNRDAPYSGPTHLIFEYPPEQRGKIRVTAEERARLQQRRYLNDSLIDFFFKYQEVALKRRTRTLEFSAKFFSSFFFGRLRRTKPIDYEGVKSWTKNVDLFANKFVFVPICESYHWSLIIVANLDKLALWLERDTKDMTVYDTPRIIYLDSLDASRGSSFGNTIRRYLVEEWLCRKLNVSDCEDRRHAFQQGFEESIPILKAKVPIQTNEYDCGLYVLNSLHMFLKNESGFMDKLLSGEDNLSDAYTHVDIQILRHKLIFLMDQFEEHWSESRGSEVHGTKKDLYESERVAEPNNEAPKSQPECELGVQEDCHLGQRYETEAEKEEVTNDQSDDLSFEKNKKASVYCKTQDVSSMSQERRGSSSEAQVNTEERETNRLAEERSTEEFNVVAKEGITDKSYSDHPVILEPETEDLKCQNRTAVGSCDDSELGVASAEAVPQLLSVNGQYEATGVQQSTKMFENRSIGHEIVVNQTEKNVTQICDDNVSNEQHVQTKAESNPMKANETEIEEGSSYEIGLHCDTGFSFKQKSRKHPVADSNEEEQAAVPSSENSADSSLEKRRRLEDMSSKPLADFEPERQFEVGFGGHSRDLVSRVGEEVEDGLDIFDRSDRSPVNYGYSAQTTGMSDDTEELHTVDHIGEKAIFKRTNKP